MKDALVTLAVEYGVLIGFASFILLVISLVISILVMTQLPADYWLVYQQQQQDTTPIMLKLIRNTLGLVLLVIGLLLLILPGQGLVTILVALMISDLPFKHRFIAKLVANPGVQKGLNTVRKWRGKAPFVFQNSSY